MKKNLYFLLAGLILLSLSACQRDSSAPAKSRQAPDFTLTTLSGENFRLADSRGKVVMLNFWATWCPPCQEELPSLADLNKAMSGKNFQMQTVALDKEGRSAVEGYFRRTGVRVPTLLDASGSVGKIFGVTGIPETFLIDKEGLIRKKIIGPINWSDPQVINYLQKLIDG
ncbi:MAG: TlpA disulfide reductase family protein [Deltaproteobacteria bacterium]